ncbi:hypothetical protein KKH36_01750 [Patescibacteria group bacterium]|nr:hypothetical protein [Patescibacteria group bacterium]
MNKKMLSAKFGPPAQNPSLYFKDTHQTATGCAHAKVPLAPDPMTGTDDFFKGNVNIGSAIAR